VRLRLPFFERQKCTRMRCAQVEIANSKEDIANVSIYVGGVELLGKLPLCGGGLTCRANEIKRAGGTFCLDNRQGGP